jgi:hypothetical protein
LGIQAEKRQLRGKDTEKTGPVPPGLVCLARFRYVWLAETPSLLQA